MNVVFFGRSWGRFMGLNLIYFLGVFFRFEFKIKFRFFVRILGFFGLI